MASAMVIGVDEQPRLLRVGGVRVVVVDGLPVTAPKLGDGAKDEERRKGLEVLFARASGPDGKPAMGSEYAVRRFGIFGSVLLERLNGHTFKTSLMNFVRRRWPGATWRTVQDAPNLWYAVAFDADRPVGIVCGYLAD